jgi:aspartate/methionine/tyrosine aminotransferase
MPGVPELRQAIAAHSQKYQGIPVEWATEALVTVGATEGIASCMLGLLNPGDEVGGPAPAACARARRWR